MTQWKYRSSSQLLLPGSPGSAGLLATHPHGTTAKGWRKRKGKRGAACGPVRRRPTQSCDPNPRPRETTHLIPVLLLNNDHRHNLCHGRFCSRRCFATAGRWSTSPAGQRMHPPMHDARSLVHTGCRLTHYIAPGRALVASLARCSERPLTIVTIALPMMRTASTGCERK